MVRLHLSVYPLSRPVFSVVVVVVIVAVADVIVVDADVRNAVIVRRRFGGRSVRASLEVRRAPIDLRLDHHPPDPVLVSVLADERDADHLEGRVGLPFPLEVGGDCAVRPRLLGGVVERSVTIAGERLVPARTERFRQVARGRGGRGGAGRVEDSRARAGDSEGGDDESVGGHHGGVERGAWGGIGCGGMSWRSRRRERLYLMNAGIADVTLLAADFPRPSEDAPRRTRHGHGACRGTDGKFSYPKRPVLDSSRRSVQRERVHPVDIHSCVC